MPSLIFTLIVCLTLVTNAQTQSKPHTYVISANDSNFWVVAGKAGLLSGLGHNHEIGVKSFTGRVLVPETGATNGSLELDVDARSLVVLDKKPSEADKKKIYSSLHNEVLESAKHQKIIFKSASVSEVKRTGMEAYSFILNGDLTLKGVTKRIAISVNATITAQQLRASGRYTLKQTDFGITPYSAAGGTVKVKNELVINFNLVANAT